MGPAPSLAFARLAVSHEMDAHTLKRRLGGQANIRSKIVDAHHIIALLEAPNNVFSQLFWQFSDSCEVGGHYLSAER